MQDHCYLSQIHGKDQEFRHQSFEFTCRKVLNPGAVYVISYKIIEIAQFTHLQDGVLFFVISSFHVIPNILV